MGEGGGGKEGGERNTNKKGKKKRKREKRSDELGPSYIYSKVHNKRERGSWRSAMTASHAAPIGK